tara:strand:+ start:493 stop:780 length:288 start_codon:yes stop_codon:yes gene_type:complete
MVTTRSQTAAAAKAKDLSSVHVPMSPTAATAKDNDSFPDGIWVREDQEPALKKLLNYAVEMEKAIDELKDRENYWLDMILDLQRQIDWSDRGEMA